MAQKGALLLTLGIAAALLAASVAQAEPRVVSVELRAARRMRPLRSQRRLYRASFRHARAMVNRRFFAHVAPDGADLVTRLRRVRYLPRRQWIVGENIAWGSRRWSSPITIVRAWMRSTSHRANVLTPAYREIGLGVHSGMPRGSRRRGATYTTDFGFWR